MPTNTHRYGYLRLPKCTSAIQQGLNSTDANHKCDLRTRVVQNSQGGLDWKTGVVVVVSSNIDKNEAYL